MKDNIDTLVSQLHLLTSAQLVELDNAFIDASIAHAAGSNWREIFKRLKFRYPKGYAHRLYKTLEVIPTSGLEAMSKYLATQPKGLKNDS